MNSRVFLMHRVYCCFSGPRPAWLLAAGTSQDLLLSVLKPVGAGCDLGVISKIHVNRPPPLPRFRFRTPDEPRRFTFECDQ